MNLRLLNHYEEVTYDALVKVCNANGTKVFPKVRIADVFKLENSGISDRLFGFGLRAHFDFLVTTDSYKPLFSVEFDGPLHKTELKQLERDQLKNQLCEHFSHGLLRINSTYISRTFRGLDLLTYFVDAWFLQKAFDKAQQQGAIASDEIFDMTFILNDGGKPDITWPYWLSLDVQLEIQKLHQKGVLNQHAPSHYVGADEDGNYRCLCWIEFANSQIAYVKTGMRAQLFPGVYASELLSMLAIFDLHAKVDKAIHIEKNDLINRDDFYQRVLSAFKNTYSLVSAAACSRIQ